MRRLRLTLLACALAVAGGAQAQAPSGAAPAASSDALQAANALVARRDWAAARATLERRLAQAPGDDEARFLLARVLAWQGEPASALPLYRVLLARAPDNADYLLGYGQAQLWAGERDAAIATLERARRLAPDYADVDRALAQARAAAAPSTDRSAAPMSPGAPSAAPASGPAGEPSASASPSTPTLASATAAARETASTPTPAQPSDPATAPGAPTPRASGAGAAVRPLEADAPPVSPAPDPMHEPARGAAATPVAPVAGATDRRRSLVLTARHDRLDRGYDDWRAWRLDAAATGGGRTGVTGALFTETRFGLDDHGIELGLVVPLRDGWSLQPQLGAVPGARFLPRHFADLRIERVFDAGWIGAASVRRSEYRDVRVERLALGVERYVGAWRAGYTTTVTRLRGAHAVGHDLRLARAYGDGGEIGVQFATGREDALLGTQVVASDVRAWSLGGRHPLSAAWALRWNAGHVRQGVLYARDGLALGLERRF